MKRFVLLLLVAATGKVFAQGELPVDINTGRPLISIPLTTISSHEISDNVGLFYNASGVRVQQPSGNFGIGWNLQAGGSITTEVRSLPDVFISTTDGRVGWRNRSNTNFAVASDVGTYASNSQTESGDYNKLTGTYGYMYDTEPDIYSFQFGGFSGKFVFDNSLNPAIRVISATDPKIAIQPLDDNYDPAGPFGPGFVITTGDGVQYFFQQNVKQTKFTTAMTSAVEFLKRDFSLYDHIAYQKAANYTIEWKLSKVLSPLGATLLYTYQKLVTPQNGVDTVKVSIRNNSPTVSYTTKNVYTTTTTTDQYLLTSIAASTGASVSFDYFGGGVSSYLLSLVTLRDTRKSTNFVASYVKQFDLTYASTTVNNFTRYFLSTVTESSGCDKMPPYTFSYIGGGLPIQSLPSPSSKNIDFWGYYTYRTNTTLTPTLYYYPSNPAAEQIRLYPDPTYSGTSYTATDANRTPDPVAMLIGTLNFIQYPTGGYTSLLYEPHQYFDSKSNQTYLGGGLRIKSVSYYDGINSSSVITKNFVYTDSTGACTGRLVSRPLFAIPVARYNDPATNSFVDKGTDWSYLMVRTEKDISLQETSSGSPVIYQEVKVYRPGSGYARFEYLTPGMYGSTAYSNWNPTNNTYARKTVGTGVAGPITAAGTWMFPNAPNINFDFERGLPWRKREYNESGVEVRRTQTYYQYLFNIGSGASPVYAVRYEYLPYSTSYNTNTTFFLGKYQWQTGISKVVQSETVKTFDVSSNTKFASTKTEYAYESDAHHLLTKVKQTAADGTIYSTKTIYPLDYGTIPQFGTDTTSQMIRQLQDKRNGMAIEQYTTIQKVNDVERVTGGTVTRFNNFGSAAFVLPIKQYNLSTNLPLTISQSPSSTSFVPSYIDPVTGTFKLDPHYINTKTNLAVDAYGNSQSSVGANRIKSTTGWGYNNSVPTVSANNAAASEFAFSDFESSTGLEFTFATGSTPFYGPGHTGNNGVYPGAKLIKILTKANTQAYILSFWISSFRNTDFTVNLRDGSTNASINGYPLSFTVPSGSGSYAYFAKSINVGNIAMGSNFVIELQSSTPLAPLTPFIDDVAFYPVGADLTSYAYTFPYGANAVTSGNQTGYTVYDNLGRQKYTLDTYKNIRSKNTYRFATDPAPTLNATFVVPAGAVEGANTFTAAGSCVDGATYSWSLDGAPTVVGGLTQTYTISGTPHTVTLTVTHPVYATVSSSKTFNVILTPCTASLGVTSSTNQYGDTNATISIAGISVNETITGYQWMTANPSGSNNWTNGSTSAQYSMSIKSGATATFDVRCQVTTNTGRTGMSNIVTVTGTSVGQ